MRGGIFRGFVGVVVASNLLALAAMGADREKPLWLVVGKPELVKAIEPLAKWRREQGFETAKEARVRFEAANAAFAFSPVLPPPDDGPWEGTIEKAARVRLLVTGGGTMHTVVLDLK